MDEMSVPFLCDSNNLAKIRRIFLSQTFGLSLVSKTKSETADFGILKWMLIVRYYDIWAGKK